MIGLRMVTQMIKLILIFILLSGCEFGRQTAPPLPSATYGTYHYDFASQTVTVKITPGAYNATLSQFENQIVDVVFSRKF